MCRCLEHRALTVLGSAGILSSVSGSSDDGSHRGRGIVRPPPGPDGDSEVEVPRLEPPPPSLEAMVQSAPLKPQVEQRSSWPVLLVLALLAAVVITAYVSR
jgi:hypothetical protein